jgi:hypothetical protein
VQKDDELVDSLNRLRESIFEAFTGIIQGLRTDNVADNFLQYVPSVVQFAVNACNDPICSDDVIRCSIGVLGCVNFHVVVVRRVVRRCTSCCRSVVRNVLFMFVICLFISYFCSDLAHSLGPKVKPQLHTEVIHKLIKDAMESDVESTVDVGRWANDVCGFDCLLNSLLTLFLR